MALFPFTPTGVNDKRNELYALSDTRLFAEADAIEADLKGWMPLNFSLTTDQSTFLAGMKDAALKYYGRQCALCFRNRLPIILTYPSPPAPGYAKWTVASDTLAVKADSHGTQEVTGTLNFTMEYRP